MRYRRKVGSAQEFDNGDGEKHAERVGSCERIDIRSRNRLRHQYKLVAINGGASGFSRGVLPDDHLDLYDLEALQRVKAGRVPARGGVWDS